MIKYFKLEEYNEAKKERNKVLFVYFACLFVYLLISGALIGYYMTLPYKASEITLVKAIHYTITGIFIIFSVIYLGIKYKITKNYYKRCLEMATSRGEQYEGNLIEFNCENVDRDGVESKTMIFLEWNKFKNEFFERKVYVPFNKEFPLINENDTVKYITQANFLVAYEIIKIDN